MAPAFFSGRKPIRWGIFGKTKKIDVSSDIETPESSSVEVDDVDPCGSADGCSGHSTSDDEVEVSNSQRSPGPIDLDLITVGSDDSTIDQSVRTHILYRQREYMAGTTREPEDLLPEIGTLFSGFVPDAKAFQKVNTHNSANTMPSILSTASTALAGPAGRRGRVLNNKPKVMDTASLAGFSLTNSLLEDGARSDQLQQIDEATTQILGGDGARHVRQPPSPARRMDASDGLSLTRQTRGRTMSSRETSATTQSSMLSSSYSLTSSQRSRSADRISRSSSYSERSTRSILRSLSPIPTRGLSETSAASIGGASGATPFKRSIQRSNLRRSKYGMNEKPYSSFKFPEAPPFFIQRKPHGKRIPTELIKHPSLGRREKQDIIRESNPSLYLFEEEANEWDAKSAAGHLAVYDIDSALTAAVLQCGTCDNVKCASPTCDVLSPTPNKRNQVPGLTATRTEGSESSDESLFHFNETPMKNVRESKVQKLETGKREFLRRLYDISTEEADLNRSNPYDLEGPPSLSPTRAERRNRNTRRSPSPKRAGAAVSKSARGKVVCDETIDTANSTLDSQSKMNSRDGTATHSSKSTEHTRSTRAKRKPAAKWRLVDRFRDGHSEEKSALSDVSRSMVTSLSRSPGRGPGNIESSPSPAKQKRRFQWSPNNNGGKVVARQGSIFQEAYATNRDSHILLNDNVSTDEDTNTVGDTTFADEDTISTLNSMPMSVRGQLQLLQHDMMAFWANPKGTVTELHKDIKRSLLGHE